MNVPSDERPSRHLGRCRVSILSVAVLVTTLMLPLQPAFGDETRTRQWHLTYLRVTQAHRYSTGAGVVVGVIDTGVDATHPDLTGSVLAGTEFGRDSESGSSSARDGHLDTDGHGTGMAGLIAGHGHGGNGVDGALGIASGARILPVRTSARRVGNVGYDIAGILWSVQHGAKVLCIAAGGRPVPGAEEAIKAAIEADVVVVAAVGNAPPTGPVGYPAAYPGVVAAAGIDEQGRHAAISVTGPEVVLAAPAVNIVSTYLNHGYAIGDGTSGATAIIAGAAALVRARYPNLSAREVVHRLTTTATDAGAPGRDEEYGYGILNLTAALTADVPPLAGDRSQPAASNRPSSAGPGQAGGTGPAVAPTTSPAAALPVDSGSGPAWIVTPIALLLLLTAGAGGWLLNRRRPPAGPPDG